MSGRQQNPRIGRISKKFELLRSNRRFVDAASKQLTLYLPASHLAYTPTTSPRAKRSATSFLWRGIHRIFACGSKAMALRAWV